jgi:hypothetical protein
MDMAITAELDSRMRYIEGEKAVTRHVLRQASLNSDDLGALKTEVRHLNEQLVLVNATLNAHGTRLDVLTQDVTMLRHEVAAVHGEMNRRFDEVNHRFGEMDRRFDGLERNIAVILAAVVPSAPSAA